MFYLYACSVHIHLTLQHDPLPTVLNMVDESYSSSLVIIHYVEIHKCLTIHSSVSQLYILNDICICATVILCSCDHVYIYIP